MNRLKEKYDKEIVQSMMQEHSYTSVMQVPRIVKVVLNIGVGNAVSDSKNLEIAKNELAIISGQKPVTTRAHRSIATFKVRQGMAIGCKVTLRRKKMYDFLDKLFNINLPRVRDFRGLNKNSFDNQGNYTLGIKEQIVFPEIDYDKVTRTRGLSITIVMSTKDTNTARSLLTKLGAPFKK